MKKYTYPPFLTMLATILVTFVHKITGFELDLELATGALAIIGNYLIMQFAADIQKIRRGEVPTGSFNSMKLITVAVICLVLGVSNYLQLDYSTEEIIVFVSMGMMVITGKGVKDIISGKGAASNGSTNYARDDVGI